MIDSYLAPSAEARAEIREKGSRFLAVLAPATDEDSARGILDELRREFPNATHHCWAWRIGRAAAERSSDDGEPSGTAGVPILQVLRGSEISDVVVVVVRWYGGTKLGKGGLARAYSRSTREALAATTTFERAPTRIVDVEVPYARVGAVKRLLRSPEVELIEAEYGETARLKLQVYDRIAAQFADDLAAIRSSD